MNKYKKIITLMNKINSSNNLQYLLATIIDSAKEICECEGASLLLHDIENEELIFDIVISDKGEIIQGKRLKVGEGIAGTVAESRKALIVNDVTVDERFFSSIDHMSGFVTQNVAAVPVMIKKKFIGVLEVVNSLKNDLFSKDDIKMLEHIADAAAIAINNHELMINLKNRVDELTCIYEISQSIYFTLDIEIFLSKILTAVNKVIKAQRCSFVILDEESRAVKHFVSTTEERYEIKLENSLMDQVIKTGDPLLVYNIDENYNFATLNTLKQKTYKSKSFICVPMKLRDRVIGVLNFTDKNFGGIFDSFDLRVLSTIANQVAETYENVLLQKHELEMEKIDTEIEIAADIQRHSFSAIPKNLTDVSIDAFNLPSSFVSGDFFEISPESDTRFTCSIGDVSGKGLSAAIYMSTVRSALRFELVNRLPQSELLTKINEWAFRESFNGMFCTLFHCSIDTLQHTITYSSAGHNEQLLYRAANKQFEALSTRGMPIGIDADGTCGIETLTYQKGDILVLFSDGLAVEDNEGELKYTQFQDMITSRSSEDAHMITTAIKQEIEKMSTGEPLVDDCTLIVIKFN